ncbi:MAG: tRNA uracil 4-sulfurtransferase ThiI [Candidatus Spechtbacterales bacterium]|nr:tRNA uracil 4-sulfurtransferase ThiI [Candidatus Spechtbacterales bacterium]
MEKVILIKIGELWLKGGNRGDFIDRLVLNIEKQSNVDKADISVEQGRIYIRTKSKAPKLEKRLSKVFGLHGFVEANKVELDYPKIKETATQLMRDKLDKLEDKNFTFRVTASRSFKEFEKTSEDVARDIGAVLMDSFSDKLSVDLKNYDINLIVEIRQEGAFLYFEDDEVKGAGGLPVGMSGRGLMMLSGGIDSPVAAWLLMKRGMLVDAVYFHSPPYTGEKTKEKIIDICQTLSEWKGSEITLYIPYFTEIQTESVKTIPDEFWTLVHRRFMVKITGMIAKDEGYQALISGESLGQVASQTIENMTATAYGSEYEVLRPLLGFDKQETIDFAKKIDTYDISIQPYEDCCTVFSASHPRTKSKPNDLMNFETKLDVDSLISKAMDKIEVYKITSDEIKKHAYNK